MARAGLYINNAFNIKLENVEIQSQKGPAYMIHNADRVEIIACGVGDKLTDKPLIYLNNVQNCSIRSCRAPWITRIYLTTGDKNKNITLDGNREIP